jgi:hypothetical protein
MIETGKSNIEWERKVPAEKIQDLKDLLNADNFDANLPTVILHLENYRWLQKEIDRDVLLRRRFVPETLCYRRRFVTETFCSGDVMLQETFCYGDVLFRRRFVPETFCYGDVLLRRRFVWKYFVEETFCEETFCMCAPSRDFPPLVLFSSYNSTIGLIQDNRLIADSTIIGTKFCRTENLAKIFD